MNNLSAKRITRLKPQDSGGRWQDESGNLLTRFALDGKGDVETLAMATITHYKR